MCVLVCLEKPETKHSATSQSQNHLPPSPGGPGAGGEGKEDVDEDRAARAARQP